MKIIVHFAIAGSLLVAAIFTVAFPNVVVAIPPTFHWCFQFAGIESCFPEHEICKNRADLVDAKCHKFKIK